MSICKRCQIPFGFKSSDPKRQFQMSCPTCKKNDEFEALDKIDQLMIQIGYEKEKHPEE